MPGINGIEVCRRLRKDPITKDIPVIFVSVCHLEKDIKASFDAGGNEYISKPFSNQDLNSKLKLFLK